ncbi:MAG: polyprenyl synthetase family protein [Erysipelotrichaceae bacterium]|nr:polyprenyl synthetase family protein [Erysipelotrichaceae bacterium]
MNNFEQYINDYLNSLKDNHIKDAMIYTMEGGKRFRPRIIFAIMKGFNLDESLSYDCALALEEIQTYSLIHDDLPAMDNDDMRRGKPSCHKAFREDIAILTGDQLLTDSFGRIASSKYIDSDAKVKIIEAFSKYAGLDGMIYGQLLDVTNTSETIDPDKLFEIQDNKTGGLFKIACLTPMYIAKNDEYDYFVKLGSLIGQIFQNQDDLFDLIKSEEETGKNKSDIQNNKGTALSISTKEELIKIIDDEFDYLYEYLEKAPFDSGYLKDVINILKGR